MFNFSLCSPDANTFPFNIHRYYVLCFCLYGGNTYSLWLFFITVTNFDILARKHGEMTGDYGWDFSGKALRRWSDLWTFQTLHTAAPGAKWWKHIYMLIPCCVSVPPVTFRVVLPPPPSHFVHREKCHCAEMLDSHSSHICIWPHFCVPTGWFKIADLFRITQEKRLCIGDVRSTHTPGMF